MLASRTVFVLANCWWIFVLSDDTVEKRELWSSRETLDDSFCADSSKRIEISRKPRKCSFLATQKRRERYCRQTNINSHCKATCGECPSVCTDSIYPLDIKGKLRKCSWISGKKNKLCKKQPIKTHCKVTCEGCPPSLPTSIPSIYPSISPSSFPSSSPSVSPTLIGLCIDSQSPFGEDNLNCSSLPSSACSLIFVQQNCPRTCRTCPCNDSKGLFYINSKKRRYRCKSKKVKKLCTNKVVANFCPMSCGLCDFKPPVVFVNGIENGSKFTNSPNISVVAIDDIDQDPEITIYVDSLPHPPGKIEVGLGHHSVIAIATDSVGNVGLSEPIIFEIIENDTPTVELEGMAIVNSFHCSSINFESSISLSAEEFNVNDVDASSVNLWVLNEKGFRLNNDLIWIRDYESKDDVLVLKFYTTDGVNAMKACPDALQLTGSLVSGEKFQGYADLSNELIEFRELSMEFIEKRKLIQIIEAQSANAPTGLINSHPSYFVDPYPRIDPKARSTKSPTANRSNPPVHPGFNPSIHPAVVSSAIPSKNSSLNPSMLRSDAPSKIQTDDATAIPSIAQSIYPIIVPSTHPLGIPSLLPSDITSSHPSLSPMPKPTSSPSANLSLNPSFYSSVIPSANLSENPSLNPSMIPSDAPTSMNPSLYPSAITSANSSENPSLNPSMIPSDAPLKTPTDNPTKSPSLSPSSSPTKTPTDIPTKSPGISPSSSPTKTPTDNPTKSPSISPSSFPTNTPTDNPTKSPSIYPSSSPTKTPSYNPTKSPSISPSSSPTKGCPCEWRIKITKEGADSDYDRDPNQNGPGFCTLAPWRHYFGFSQAIASNGKISAMGEAVDQCDLTNNAAVASSATSHAVLDIWLEGPKEKCKECCGPEIQCIFNPKFTANVLVDEPGLAFVAGAIDIAGDVCGNTHAMGALAVGDNKTDSIDIEIERASGGKDGPTTSAKTKFKIDFEAGKKKDSKTYTPGTSEPRANIINSRKEVSKLTVVVSGTVAKLKLEADASPFNWSAKATASIAKSSPGISIRGSCQNTDDILDKELSWK